jgi:hypothetical protein
MCFDTVSRVGIGPTFIYHFTYNHPFTTMCTMKFRSQNMNLFMQNPFQTRTNMCKWKQKHINAMMPRQFTLCIWWVFYIRFCSFVTHWKQRNATFPMPYASGASWIRLCSFLKMLVIYILSIMADKGEISQIVMPLTKDAVQSLWNLKWRLK